MMNLYERFGISETTFSAETLLRRAVGSNAESHIRGMAGEMVFETVAQGAPAEAHKVPDNDRSKRYDYDVYLAGCQLPMRVECKVAGKKGEFNVDFRDQRIIPFGDEKIKGNYRTVHESFDYVAVNLINVTGSWLDIAYIRFKDIPKLKITNRNRKKFENLSQQTQEQVQTMLLSGSLKVSGLPHHRTFADAVKEFISNGQPRIVEKSELPNHRGEQS